MSIIAKFNHSVINYGNRTAVQCDKHSLTYEELDKKSNQVANLLLTKGIKPETIVPVMAGRSLEFVVSILGIIKAGGAYLPIAVNCPEQKLDAILALTEAKIVLSIAPSQNISKEQSIEFIDVTMSSKLINGQSELPIDTQYSENELVYVIFTSGTTGVPKGVQIEHGALTVRVSAFQKRFEMNSNDRCSFVASTEFDPSVQEIWTTLCSGATICIPDDETKLSPILFCRWLQKQNISVVYLPTPLMELFLLNWNIKAEINSLRLLLTGGEQLKVRPPKDLRVPLLNCYGPSETTINATVGLVEHEDCQSNLPHIGKPLPFCLTYLLDDELQPVPYGEIGELYIGGQGLSRGYLKQPELTAKRFLLDPFNDSKNARMYATGDRCRQLPEGDLQFIGRNDEQVKIRGFRVELGEIEASLISLPLVKQAVVSYLSTSQSIKLLVAHLILENGAILNVNDFRKQLGQSLPSYMLPERYIIVDEFPLTSNSKVDKSKLSLPEVITDKSESSTSFSNLATKLASYFKSSLNLDYLNYDSNFFECGGNSIAAIVLLDLIFKHHDVKMPLKHFFESPTVLGVESFIMNNSGTKGTSVVPRTNDRQNITPLSSHQQIIWFQRQLEPQSKAYHFKSMLRLKGELNIDALEQSLSELITRHEILRTTVDIFEDEPVQFIHAPFKVKLSVIDLQHLSIERAEQECRGLLDGQINKVFEIQNLPLIRWQLIHIRPNYSVLLHVEHHMIHDGWSFNIFLDELVKLYRIHTSFNDHFLTQNNQYADYTVALNNWLGGAEAKKQLAYWQKQLEGAPAVLNLPKKKNADLTSYTGKSKRTIISRSVWEKCENYAKENSTTPFIYSLAVLNIVLGRFSNQSDVCIGSWFANRSWSGTDSIIGMLVNSIVLRNKIDLTENFSHYLKKVKNVALDGYENQELPFSEIVKEIKPERLIGHNPLFQVILGFHDSPTADLNIPNLNIELVEGLTSGYSKFDLSVVVIPRLGQDGENDPIHMVWEYRSDVYETSLIENIIDSFLRVFEKAMDGDLQLSDLPVVNNKERAKLLQDFNPHILNNEPSKCVFELFEAQVEKQPDATALVFGMQSLSYRELNIKANQLANYLIGLGVKPDTLVGVCIGRSSEMVIALLGILKSGAAYVPLDPEYPKRRLDYMLNDSDINMIVTQTEQAGLVSGNNRQLILVDDTETKQDIGLLSQDNPAQLLQGFTEKNLAYVIYTSGSTGQPKGVCVEHASINNFLNSMQKKPGLKSTDKLLAITSIGFDIAVLELYLPLIMGAELHVASQLMTQDMSMLSNYLNQSDINIMQATPATWQMLLYSNCWQGKPSFKVLCGGDTLTNELANQLKSKCGELWNLYGPTESTVWSSCLKVEDEVSIGRVIDNAQLHILGDELSLLPIGTVGELYIGGKGLARGYLNQEILTAEKFVQNPYSNIQGDRLYKTGDVARRLANGNIELLGRIDQQVKVRGFRIELGEIEAQLLSSGLISNCVVNAQEHESGGTQLIAFVVPNHDHKNGKGLAYDLTKYLRQQLPPYMIPSAFIELDKLPLTVNGKIDRKALFEASVLPQPRSELVVPGNKTEQDLAELFCDVLALDTFSINDSFFDLGGHSILATKLISRVFRAFGIAVSMQELLEMPSPAQLATAILVKQMLSEDYTNESDEEEVIF